MNRFARSLSLLLVATAFCPNDGLIRVSRVRFHANSIYFVGFHRHWIRNVTGVATARKCAMLCNNDLFCRTANYMTSTSMCCLYEERVDVGLMSSSSSCTVITVHLCPDGIDESTHLCLAIANRPPVPLQVVFNSMSLVNTLPVRTSSIQMTSELLSLPISGSNYLLAYPLGTDIEQWSVPINNRSITSCPIVYFDMTTTVTGQNVAYVCSGQRGISRNSTVRLSSTVWFGAPCFTSDTVIAPMIYGNALRVWSLTSSAFYDLPGFSFDAANWPNTCAVLNGIVYVPSQSAIEFISLRNASSRTRLRSFSATPDGIYIDAIGPRFYVACSSCQNTSISVLSLNGSLIANIKHGVGHVAAKISKLQYLLFLTNASHLSIHRYS
jgi:hypothetical protein